MQVAAYARVSTRRQTQTQTIEQQLDRLRTHAAARGWELAQENVFRDDGHSCQCRLHPGSPAFPVLSLRVRMST